MDIYNLTEDDALRFLEEQGVTDILKQGLQEEISPKWDDLARLYLLVRERKPFEILEFGSGFSTIVMAHALKLNWEEYLKKTSSIQQNLYENPASFQLSPQKYGVTIHSVKLR